MHPIQSLPSNEASVAQVQRYRLPNGLRVWAQPRPGTGTVALILQVMVGSRHEREADSGISHFLEHMVFTGTERWNEDEVMDVVRRRGGTSNAQTGSEDTCYYLNINAEHLDFGLDWLDQVVFRSTLPADKVAKERHVITNEKGGEIGRLRRVYEWLEDHQLGWNVGRAVRTHLFPKSALLRPVIGVDKSLRAIDHAALLRHYRTYYVPNNAVLIAVGDFIPQALHEAITATFGHVPTGSPPPDRADVRVDSTPFHLRLRGPAPNEQGQWMIGAPLPGNAHPDRYPLWVICEILERAYMQEIRFERGLTYGVSVYTALYADVGYFGIYTQTETANFPQIRAIIERGLARLLAGDFDDEELDSAKTALRGRALLDLQSNYDLAWWHSVDTVFVPDDAPVPDYFAHIAAVDRAAVICAANTYLRPQQRFSVEHVPAITPRRALPWVGAAGAAFSTALAAWRIGKGR